MSFSWFIHHQHHHAEHNRYLGLEIRKELINFGCYHECAINGLNPFVIYINLNLLIVTMNPR